MLYAPARADEPILACHGCLVLSRGCTVPRDRNDPLFVKRPLSDLARCPLFGRYGKKNGSYAGIFRDRLSKPVNSMSFLREKWSLAMQSVGWQYWHSRCFDDNRRGGSPDEILVIPNNEWRAFPNAVFPRGAARQRNESKVTSNETRRKSFKYDY